MNFPKILLLLSVVCVGQIGAPALAQMTNAGPVRFPSSTAAAPTVDPASNIIPSSSALPATNMALAPAAPIVSTPVLSAPIQIAAPAQSADVSGDIHDIRGVISIPYEWLWAAYALAGLVAMGLIYAALRFFRRAAKARAKLPYEIALERLEEARSLMTVDTVREYAFTVSEIIRVYIEQCFGEKAARRTTEEFLSDLLKQTGTPLAERRGLLEDFLNHCDLIKFARWGASERELESMQESARAFILDTRPQPEAVQPTKATASSQPELSQAK